MCTGTSDADISVPRSNSTYKPRLPSCGQLPSSYQKGSGVCWECIYIYRTGGDGLIVSFQKKKKNKKTQPTTRIRTKSPLKVDCSKTLSNKSSAHTLINDVVSAWPRVSLRFGCRLYAPLCAHQSPTADLVHRV